MLDFEGLLEEIKLLSTVNYEKLENICEFKRGNVVSRSNLETGNIPVISSGIKPSFYTNIANRGAGYITVASSGNAGYVSFQDEPFFCMDAFTIRSLDENKVLTKYLYYCLANIQNEIYSFKKGGAIQHVYPKDFYMLYFPIPSLEIQNKIVHFLDVFTALITALITALRTEEKKRKEKKRTI